MDQSNEMNATMDLQIYSIQLHHNGLNFGLVCIGVGLICVGVGLGYVGIGLCKQRKIEGKETERKMDKEDWGEIWKMIENRTQQSNINKP